MTSLRKDAIELLEHRSENTSIVKEKAFERLEQLRKKVPDIDYDKELAEYREMKSGMV